MDKNISVVIEYLPIKELISHQFIVDMKEVSEDDAPSKASLCS